MKLADMNPRHWFAPRAKAAPPGVQMTARQSAAQGPFTKDFRNIVPREVNPWLYETLRETIPVIDGAIDRLCTLDGILAVEAESSALEEAIKDFMDNVQVNDLDHGMQTFYKIAGNEKYEQGFVVGEYVLGRGGKNVQQLRVADSKGIYFQRANGTLDIWYSPPTPKTAQGNATDKVQRALRNSYQSFSTGTVAQMGYRKLDTARLFYQAIDVEASNPYGTSKMRSLEFCSKTLLTLHNAVLQTWERFGDPVFELTYKTKARVTPEELTARQKMLADNLAKALEAKRAGNAMDFVNAVGKDDDLVLKVIGADNQVLELEMPARHLLEQIVSKWGIAPWMLGFIWGTSERLADRQSDMVLQDTKTRFANARGGLESIIATDLRARGITWKRGDWKLTQELPNLKSELETAQADFLRAQTQLMLSGAGVPRTMPPQADPGTTDEAGKLAGLPPILSWARSVRDTADKSLHKSEEYVEDGANLMRLERHATRALLTSWRALSDATLSALGLPDGKSAAKADINFIFGGASLRNTLLMLEADFVAEFGAENSDAAHAFYQAWVAGVANGAGEFNSDAVTGAIRERQRAALRAHGLEQVTDTTVRSYRADIMDTLTNGDYDGQNPRDVARALRSRFAAHDYDWERLARSEVAYSQGLGKEDQYRAQGIEKYDWLSAGGACVICTSLESAGPYPVGSGPLPARDSHPNCRCTVAAVV